ncbi:MULTISPECIES: DNA topoisomerase IV subunit B [Sphingomonadales]|uniref:DNA topoisomerase IV subunit B n=1 Tax=Sphingomonadales TaxID=204457 RepID=UPI0006C90235|nr:MULTISPECIES: DNA topoisomerase IV subunit B [Sphingomonadales]KPM25556.1 DNA topoisomerase IV subunit B [Citromicrobium sp. RCC1885]KPM28798.1 DNA topoisomerase IV subunit B [Citromicrobium sp. RCC1878]MAO02949.1 DNA topoisomerase IV subunit B [Citromicrobium sp.]OAM09652.1 DNA topoisomerase IV subunit B [Citromicrobium sp. RCC1897]|tara:strand:+ start:546 stop:2534 length:1989 start_codon:yes stop_codon:yes gene_type:complete
MSDDLFEGTPTSSGDYDSSSIEVLEGLEPVRRRPGMYIGGTDDRALHHLAAEVLDNSMDEAVAGHATRIEVKLEEGNRLTIADNGRGMPIDEHPKFPGKSTLEVILSTLHSGGKFSGKAYATSGGLHGVGVSVVNALSEHTRVEVARDKTLYAQEFSKGQTLGPIETVGAAPNRRGTTVSFTPDPEIFGPRQFSAKRLFKLARSKAYLFAGVEIRWKCAPSLATDDVPEEETFKFPGGLADHLTQRVAGRECVTAQPFAGSQDFPSVDGVSNGRVEWAIAWPLFSDAATSWYCNTVPTPDGGTHEQGLRNALTKGLRAFGELVGQKKAKDISADDVMAGAEVLLSVFIRDPQFQSQTKDRLTSPEATKLVENAVRDHFDHFLADNMERGKALLGEVMERMDERLRRRAEREVKRKTATNAKKLRLPGKLTDCSGEGDKETELFIVEGDSAGGSAKQARDRKTQAILPIRGKILNVASASADKIRANSEIADLILALGCGVRKDCDADQLRYDRVVIMTDADVDGAHIATLLMTFFFQEMPDLVRKGHLFLAQPPLYRLTAGKESRYARDEEHRRELEETVFKGKKIEISRFKGLGEMNPAQLRETTMHPDSRSLIRITLPPEFEDRAAVKELVGQLMGRNPEHRFQFIQNKAGDLDRELIDA